MMKNKNGISLIVLVITIIVMIILAGSIILSLSNNGIINRASEAVDSTDIANMQDLATMLWAEAYLDFEGKATVEDLREAVITGLSKADPDYAKRYNVDVTEKGVSVTWIYLNRPYIYTGTDEDGNEIKETYIFYEDGSAEKYDSYDWISESFESGTCSYSSNSIVMGDKIFEFTNGKETLICDNKEYNVESELIWAFCETNSMAAHIPEKILFFAEQNMTWGIWCDNDTYNKFNFRIIAGIVNQEWGSDLFISENDRDTVSATEQIIKGHIYFYISSVV